MAKSAFCPVFIVVLISLLVSAGAAQVDEEPKTGPTQRLEALRGEIEQAWERLDRDRSAAETDEEREAATERYWQQAEALSRRALALAEEHPGDPVAAEALSWILTGGLGAGPRSPMADEVDRALTLLERDHLDSEHLVGVCRLGGLTRLGSEAMERLLRSAMEWSPHRDVRGTACFAMAERLRGQARLARMLREPARFKMAPGMEDRLDGDLVRRLAGVDPEALDRRAEELFERVVAEYADVMPLRPHGSRLGDQAQGALFKMRHLRIGQPAPEIQGEDLEGRPLRLGDYRSKVVVLVFWASWCGPCMAMLPQERALVEEMRGRPFVLLGINGDSDREAALRAQAEGGVTWRSWWDGADGQGPIALRWDVEGWPDTYVIDHEGVIRCYNVYDEQLGEAVRELVSEAEGEPGGGSGGGPRR